MQIISSVIFLVFFFTTYVYTVRIGSFNLHQYGSSKAADSIVTGIIADILNDFDVAAIQEITDVTMKAPYILLDSLNKRSLSRPYSMALSGRVGRSTSKEQFIFFNRESTSGVKLIDNYLYDDKSNYFERPPFIGTFQVTKMGSSGIKYFTIMNVHLRPTSAYQELIDMRHVIRDFILQNPQYFSQTSTSLAQALSENIIDATASHKPSLKTNHPILIVGDCNSDCSYISLTRQQSLRSINYADFVWMINNQVKTNTRQTCTYDRILINGDKFVGAIVPGSNTTVNFQQDFDLTLNEALDVSDHFPVKFDIRW
ncbi:unnamed protein product [Rotaria magnacalcarata]|uniref:Deoxyribonuclease n=3 Tax=Rotaria magnacalcarata TaxID=392030 RepID=A0A817APD1_9BILA|nr:unnamed protein product [Rotaria magnacalcarata]CAF1319278.1 unnamed protein product [Rotaria magnacalcarata]CAF2267608.1 unnamed protein product [Rotaria magnacalcarata]CAF5045823.1 unnamed protein product [Rotaria magnacalcarata]CAF5162221.1 unnamed protein product [Rotaria magnacalcarata]